MNLFVSEIVAPPVELPIVTKQVGIARSVVDEIERTILWRAVVSQERRILIDGPLPPSLEIEPVTAIVGLTRWTPTNDAAVIDAASYHSVTRDPAGTIIMPAPGNNWPAPERPIGSFALTYMAGWTVAGVTNEVPVSVQFMVSRAISFREGAGLGDFSIGSLKIDVADSYSTDKLPKEIASIGRAWAYRPGIFAARA